MDKFGVFNLISSLLSQYKSSSNAPSPAKTQEENTKTSVAKTSSPDAKPFLPLQESMLSTIRNHDSFVKRVVKENAKNKP